MDGCRPYTLYPKSIYLILHQGNQRGNNQSEPGEHKSWYLEDDTLTSPRGQ